MFGYVCFELQILQICRHRETSQLMQYPIKIKIDQKPGDMRLHLGKGLLELRS